MVTTWIDLKAILDVRRADNLKAIMVIRHPATVDLKSVFHVGQNSADFKAQFYVLTIKDGTPAELKALIDNLRRAASVDLAAEFVVRHSTSAEFKGILIVRHSATADFKALAVIRHTATPLQLPAEFRITVEAWEMQGLTAETYRALGVIS